MGWIYISNQIIIYPIWPKCWQCHKRKGDQNFAILSFFFSYCNYLNGGTHQGSVSNLIFTETLNELFPDAEALQNCLLFLFLEVLLPKSFFCQNKNYCSQENRLNTRPHDEEYLISKMDLKACLKYSWTEIAIPNLWLGRELFKAIPVYLFLTALIEPCLHDMCRCLLSSHPFMFLCLIFVGAFLVLSFFMFWALTRIDKSRYIWWWHEGSVYSWVKILGVDVGWGWCFWKWPLKHVVLISKLPIQDEHNKIERKTKMKKISEEEYTKTMTKKVAIQRQGKTIQFWHLTDVFYKMSKMRFWCWKVFSTSARVRIVAQKTLF